MEQSDKILSDAIEQMERHLNKCRDSTSCNLPMGVMLSLARILRDERDARRATVRQAVHHGERLEGEITERSQRQLEITGRLAALERRMSMAEVVVKPKEARGCYQDPEHDTPWCAVHDEVPDWSGEIPGWSGRAGWVCAKGGLVAEAPDGVLRDRAKVRDLEAQVAAQQKVIDDVWALVEKPDGYGSPYWSEPGLDDTTPAEAVERLAASRATLADALDRATARISEWRREAERLGHVNAEAMAALNAADRQSDDDQICGC